MAAPERERVGGRRGAGEDDVVGKRVIGRGVHVAPPSTVRAIASAAVVAFEPATACPRPASMYAIDVAAAGNPAAVTFDQLAPVVVR